MALKLVDMNVSTMLSEDRQGVCEHAAAHFSKEDRGFGQVDRSAVPSLLKHFVE